MASEPPSDTNTPSKPTNSEAPPSSTVQPSPPGGPPLQHDGLELVRDTNT